MAGEWRYHIAQRLADMPDTTCLSVGMNPETVRDLLVISERPREDVFGRATTETNLPHQYVDDAVILGDDSLGRIGVAYRTRSEFVEQAGRIACGEDVEPRHTQWSLGPWLPESFAGDLSRAHAFGEVAHPDVRAAIVAFSAYPRSLREAIIAYCADEIAQKSRYLNYDDDPLTRYTAVSDMTIAGIRTVFARASQYFGGLRYAKDQKNQLASDDRSEVERLLSLDLSNERVNDLTI